MSDDVHRRVLAFGIFAKEREKIIIIIIITD